MDTRDETEMRLSSGVAAFEAKQFTQAMKLLSPLAETGSAEAQYRLAIMHQNGLGVVRNELLAYKWIKVPRSRTMGLLCTDSALCIWTETVRCGTMPGH